MAPDGDPTKRLTITAVAVARLAQYARTAVRPGGIRYLVRRTFEETRFEELMAKSQEIVARAREDSQRLLHNVVMRAYEKSEPLIRLCRLENLDSMLLASHQLGKLVAKQTRMRNKPIDIAIVSTIEDYVVAAGIDALPRPARRIFQVVDPTESGSRRDFNVAIPRDHTASEASTLIIYATPAFLSLWDRVEEDLDRFLVERLQVSLVLVQPRFRPLDFASHSYLLSLLLSCFPARKFDTSLEVYIAPQSSPNPKARMVGWMRILSSYGWRFLKESCAAICGRSLAESPQRFSALVISVKRPPKRMIAHVDYRALGITDAIIPPKIGVAKRSDGAPVLTPGFSPRVGSRIQVRLRMNGFLTWYNEFVVAVWRSDSVDFVSLVKRYARAGQRVFIDHKFEFKATTLSRIDLEVRIGLSRPTGVVYVNGDPSGQDHSLPVPSVEILELN
jgi:hypothetical protein